MMTSRPTPRQARADDFEQLLPLWASLFEKKTMADGQWRMHARDWFSAAVVDPSLACFPVMEVDGRMVACAVGTLELGVPNPQCPRGRAVRLVNVVTVPEHRGRGYDSAMVDAVIEWARAIHADRLDLSATPAGQRIYERAGFMRTFRTTDETGAVTRVRPQPF